MIGKIVFAAIDFAFSLAMATDSGIDRGKRLVRSVRERLLPTPDEEAFPLTFKDVEHQRAQMRSATTGAARRPRETLRPPPRED